MGVEIPASIGAGGTSSPPMSPFPIFSMGSPTRVKHWYVVKARRGGGRAVRGPFRDKKGEL